MSKKSNNNYGISTFGLLGTAFVVLKLTRVIDWSWWWVTLPFWIGIPIILIMLAIILFVNR